MISSSTISGTTKLPGDLLNKPPKLSISPDKKYPLNVLNDLNDTNPQSSFVSTTDPDYAKKYAQTKLHLLRQLLHKHKHKALLELMDRQAKEIEVTAKQIQGFEQMRRRTSNKELSPAIIIKRAREEERNTNGSEVKGKSNSKIKCLIAIVFLKDPETIMKITV